jgi:hypothetical protein
MMQNISLPNHSRELRTIAALLIFVVIMASDCLTSWQIWALGGIELNPVIVPVTEYLLQIKIAVIALVIIAAVIAEHYIPGVGWTAPALSSVIPAIAVMSNISVLLSAVI